MDNVKNIATELQNNRTQNLDQMTVQEILMTMNAEDASVPMAIRDKLPEIQEAVEAIVASFKSQGRLFYIGAGTSGRLGVLDASECPPTFGVPNNMVIGIIAGGDDALRNPIEGAEDNADKGAEDFAAYQPHNEDILVGLAASGRTPYVIGALEYAKEHGIKTVAITCNPGSVLGEVADIAIEVDTGPEVLTGSTRLKAGTAQKLILNMLTTASMVQIGKAYQNYMVDVQATNAKLIQRAKNMVMTITGVSEKEAEDTLKISKGSAKVAIIMITLNVSYDEAIHLIEQAQGHLRPILERKETDNE